MSTHLYLIKLFRNNFATLLYFHKPLNYKSSSMRNDYIFKNNVVALAEKLRNRRNEKEKIKQTTRSYRTLK